MANATWHHERRPGAPSVELVQVAGGNHVARPRAEIDQYVALRCALICGESRVVATVENRDIGALSARRPMS
jgi:hypothetical protein